eukprot:3175391-Pyramimonas_sp.AAC.1
MLGVWGGCDLQARWSGVYFLWLYRLGVAPCCSRMFTISELPIDAARCMAVSPVSGLQSSTSTPAGQIKQMRGGLQGVYRGPTGGLQVHGGVTRVRVAVVHLHACRPNEANERGSTG